MSKKREITKEEEVEICNLYRNKHTIRQINKKLNIPSKRISLILKNNGFDLSQAVVKKKYNCWKEAFKYYTKESCYYAGLIASDGCVSSKRKDGKLNILTITLKEEDLETLEKLKEYLRYTGKIYYSDKIHLQKQYQYH